MKRITTGLSVKVWVALSVVLIAADCEDNPVSSVEASLYQDVKLKVGQQAFIKGENLTITFVNVVEDSRCPIGLECFWEGNGKIVLDVKKSDSPPASLSLNTSLEPRRSAYLNYLITFKALDPYPHRDTRINERDYLATVIVSRYDVR